MTEYHALVIGNSLYENKVEFPSIEYAAQDATKVFSLLTESPTSIFSKETSICRFNVSRNDIEDLVSDFFGKVQRADTVLFYFAGHARLIGGKRLFLVMQNSLGDNLARSSFCVESLIPYFEEKLIDRYMLVLDCCRAGAALNSPGIRYRGIINDFDAHALSGQGQVLVASTRDYQLAHELEDLQQGLFSYYFINGIETGEAAEPSKPYINILELVSYVQTQIAKKHPDIPQNPLASGSDLTGDLIVAKNSIYRVEEANQIKFMDFYRKSLGLEDFSDTERLQQAQINKLRSYLDKLLQVKSDIASVKHLALLYGEALGIDEATTAMHCESYEASLKFEKPAAIREPPMTSHSKGQAVIFAARAGNASFDVTDLKSGLFSYYFREALLGHGANSDGDVTLFSAFEYLQRNINWSDRYVQQPRLTASLQDDLILTSKRIDWQSSFAKRLAILVGVNSYSNPSFPRIRYAESDIRATAEILGEMGGFECRILTDNKATLTRVQKTLADACEELSEEDLILFYFSGHGLANKETGYALLYDTEPSNLEATSLATTKLSEMFSHTKAAATLTVFDSSMMPIGQEM
jgi:uncharacterized caspase-like protein